MNEFNSFQKLKGLLHTDHFNAINKGEFLPPYCVCTDPSNDCMLECVFCNTKKYRDRTNMPAGHLIRLAQFYKEWGVQSTIIEGGGEPLLNPETPDFIELLGRYDVETGVITNGVLLHGEAMYSILECCRFVGISLDAATRQTYYRMKNSDSFNQVMSNIIIFNKLNTGVDINVKFLIHEYNYTEIYAAAKLAKDIGCCGIHIKPVAFDNVPGVKRYDLSTHKERINEQITHARELEDDTFSVYAIMYKFGDNLETKLKFEKCTCTPIGGVFGADGNFWLCFNSRGRPGFNLCAHTPDPREVKRVWGSEYHKYLIRKINPTDCMRCGLTAYNEINENCIKQDKMFWKFL